MLFWPAFPAASAARTVTWCHPREAVIVQTRGPLVTVHAVRPSIVNLTLVTPPASVAVAFTVNAAGTALQSPGLVIATTGAVRSGVAVGVGVDVAAGPELVGEPPL